MIAAGLLVLAVCPQANSRLHFDRSEVSALGAQLWVSILETEHSAGTFLTAHGRGWGEEMEVVPAFAPF